MNYTKIQKFTSSLVLFSLLFGITFRIPFYDFSAYAENEDFFNLVSVIVDEDTYPEIKSELNRYAKDIQGVLENTKVVILPTPVGTPAFNIASLNESLFYEGYKSIDNSVDFESKLIGTVLVGDFELPFVYDKNESSKTIVPFTDFDDKAYIYNHSNSRYEKNDNNLSGIKSEIWHGVISPNLGDFDSNVKGLKDYFDKNHDFYAGSGNFKFSEGVLNGNKNTPVNSSYEPFVFYYDQFREEKGLNYNKYVGYKAFLENKEDIVYNRFTKELADEITGLVLGQSTDDISKMADSLNSKVEKLGDNSPFGPISEEMKNALASSSGPDSSQTPDIQTRHIINNLVNKFLETFSKGSMGDFRTDARGVGRYSGTGGEVNVDLIPYIVTVLDLINDNIIKEANDDIENKIDDLVKNGLSRNIAVPTDYYFEDIEEKRSYQNYLFGSKGKNIQEAEYCSIYRGNTNSLGQLVEANRGLNINLVKPDLDELNNTCKQQVSSGRSLTGIWGSNTPLGLDSNSASNGNLSLKNSNLNGSIVPLFDITGSKEILDISKNPSPLNCFDNNYLLSHKEINNGSRYRINWSGSRIFELPTFRTDNVTEANSKNWNCFYDDNTKFFLNENRNFEDIFKSQLFINDKCGDNKLFLDGNIIKSYKYNEISNNTNIHRHTYSVSSTDDEGNTTYTSRTDSYSYTTYDCTPYYYSFPGSGIFNQKSKRIKNVYKYKSIPSYIKHKSPNFETLSKQIENGITPSLPIDKDRYIDFIGARGNYLKIDYPALFRIKASDETNITIDSIKQDLDKVLNEKSKEINDLIDLYNPNFLNGKDLELYNILKNGPYPSSNFDLVKYLKDKEEKTFSIAGEQKTLSYYDALVFSIYWNNLNSVSAKYGFVFDKYLTDQFGEDGKYFLPKNKKQYEIAYIGANGDSSNMYIKMDPEGKAENPYGDILSQNINLSSSLLASNVGKTGEEQASDNKCSPPGGVPIWEWFPAIMCRIGEMKPEIIFSDGACGESILKDDEENSNENYENNNPLNGEKCIGDLDDNGVSDCVENNLVNGNLVIESDSNKYYYNSTAKLKTSLKDQNGNIVKSDNASKISYEIIKIEDRKDKTKDLSNTNKEVVFDINNTYLKDKSIISKYVNFNENTFRNKFGQTKYSIGLKSKVSNIYLRAFVEKTDFSGNKTRFIESEPLILKIRGDRLFASAYKFINDEFGLDISSGANSVKVSDKANIYLSDLNINKDINTLSNSLNNNSTSEEKIVFLVNNISSTSSSLALEYPLEVIVYKDGEEYQKTTINKNEINSFKALSSIKKTGNYSIEIIDKSGSKIEKKFVLMPEKAEKLDIVLGTTVMESPGNISTNFVTIYDKFDNVVSGEYYNIDFNITGNDSLLFSDNKEKKYSSTTFEGYKIFRLESLNPGLSNIGVKISKDNETVREKNTSVRVLDEIKIDVEDISDIKVGGGEYSFKIKVTSVGGQLLNDFNSRIYLKSDSLFIGSKESFSEIKNGEAEIKFFTKNLAGKDIDIEFQVEGLNTVKKTKIDILPDKPVKIDLVLSNSKIEADINSSSILYVELKDRYNNLVYNDNSTQTNLEILDKYKHIISSNNLSKTVSSGKTSYEIKGTLNPGVAYFKVGTNPNLSINSFNIVDKNGEVTINGVGENASKIETFYFWNKDKLEGKKYNSIYTNLLGSSYGDITKEDYLAGSLLFEKENRALAVTSLLNDTGNYSKIIDLQKSGGLKSIYSTSDLSQDINFSPTLTNDKLGFDIYNKALNNYIGKVYYNFADENSLISCENNINECIDKEKTSILLKSNLSNYNVFLENNKLFLRNNIGETLLEINKDGTINRNAGIDFEINKNNDSEYLSVNIIRGNQNIAELVFNFVNSNINLSRDETAFNTKINNFKNTILVLTKSNNYGIYDESGNKIFYYLDPFSSYNPLDNFSKDNLSSFENFPNKQSMGWKEGNKSLLSFAAGKSVGESTKDYMSFGLINLGDPVISLKKIKENLPKTNIKRQFDSTIGNLLSNDDDILSYEIFDYNNDQRDDILLIKNNGYLKLLENKKIEGGFLDKGNLAHIVDLGNNKLIKTGDFSGDGFSDIFFVNDDGKPFILDNKQKDFVRYSLKEEFDLAGNILQTEVFDMDNDGIDDIVTLDDFGEINIFYGKSYTNEPKFIKKLVSSGHGIKINSEISSHNSLIYFDKLIDLFEDKLDNDNISLVLVDYPYDFNYSNKNLNYSLQDTNLENALEKVSQNNQIQNTKFIKSEYSEYAGLKVEKKFSDINSGFLTKDDIIDVEITLTNISDKNLKDIIFTEKVPELLKLDRNSITINNNEKISISSGNLGYHFLVDDLELNSGDILTINYKAKVRAFEYGFLDVGLFEKGEVGDDSFGDIIFKQDNKNCSENLDIFRSTSSRNYQKGLKELSCDEDKIKLPDELEKNTIDLDGNGIPDYIDRLTDTNNMSEIQDYSENRLADMYTDTDGDGLPDDEDLLEGSILGNLFSGTTDFNEDSMEASVSIGMGNNLNNIDSQLDNVQNLFNSLNCGNASCFASPLNWAPLAPGSDPVFNGKLIGDGLKVDEGIPIFSALTGMQYGPVWGPSIWPPSPLAYDSPGSLGAGGRLGVNSATNFFRLFVTPTLTGGVGTAICFGGPAIAAGNIMPEGLSPLVPGGNCIVLAKKMNFCSGDGSDGDVASIGNPNYSGNGSFGFINGNCGVGNTSSQELTEIKNSNDPDYREKMKNNLDSLFEGLPGEFSEFPISSPFIDGGNDKLLSVKLDLGSIDEGNFDDIIQIQKSRISAFPGFLMDWVTRQIEEIVNKLTDFPTLFIILPDFSGIFDGNWDVNSGNKAKTETGFFSTDDNLSGAIGEKKVEKVNSGIKEAYEFIGSIPLVKIEQQTIDITIPWMSGAEIDKAIETRTQTIEQRKNEIQRAKEAWSLGIACEYKDPIKQQKCEEQNALSSKTSVDLILNLELALQKLRDNLEIIKEYKEFPERINELINTKQKYLEQILCNIESISSILGGRIGKNGDIFKTWVELYILIKAILKSWQMLIDVFVDFEMECNECKNERQDALETEFSLIDMIMPQIPVIQFPKWPDIILDLHNIRAGLNIALPEFNINTKPIILPQLPKLFLPEVPSVNLALNIDLAGILDIPLLPRLYIPDLPDIPSLPTVNLPDLPPPPKLPKMFASLEVVLDIIKLITKAMCILKSLPIHPEWRAGDQIAFLTERGGYLGTDFINVSLPQFSFPFLDAVKVTTYVNLEFETDFIVELARQIAMPINSFTNDFTNIFDLKIPNLDLRGILPASIDLEVKIDKDGVSDNFDEAGDKFGDSLDKGAKSFGEKTINDIDGVTDQINDKSNDFDNLKQNLNESSFNNKQNLIALLADRIGLNMKHFSNVLEEGKDDTVTNLEFQKLINNSLASKSISSDPRFDNLRKLWSDVNNMTYSKENELIEELKENNNKKFETLKNIINTEIIKTKSLKEKIELIGNDTYLNKVSDNTSNVYLYNEKLDVYNKKFIDTAKKLYSQDLSINEELKEMGKNIITPLQKYGSSSKKSEILYANNNNNNNNNLYAETTNSTSTTQSSLNSCQAQAGSDTRYDYKGIYIIENDISYRLFNYLDELNGNEEIKLVDFDKDQDEDILYFVDGQLFLKENLDKKPSKSFVSDNPIILKSEDNKFFNEEIFIEAVNNVSEIGVDSYNINIGFTSPTDGTISNFKIGFYNRVDKYINEKNSNYRPEFIQKDIIDAFVDIPNSTKIEENEFYIKRNNLAHIKNIGNFRGLELTTKNLVNIKDNLISGNSVNITKGTKIYTGENSSNIKYILNDNDEEVELSIEKYKNIEFQNDIKIIAISGDLFIEGSDDIVLIAEEIKNFKGYPLFAESKIKYVGNKFELSNDTYIDLEYYDSSIYPLDFNYVNSFEIYDLGIQREKYNLRLNRENDYYYLKIQSFKNNIYGTLSNQVLLSPQIEADENSPILSIPDIKIPVYQKQEVDITSYVYEDSGINNIKEVFIDFDLENDTNGNGNKKDDNDSKLDGKYKDKVEVKYGLDYLKLELGSFEHIFRKKVGVTIIDKNDNISYREITFQVYSPNPEITDYSDGIIKGQIDENLTDEPIDLYRFRGGVITKISDEKVDTISGEYSYDIQNTGSGIILTNSGNTFLKVNESTGKIDLIDFGLTTKVLSSSHNLNDTPFVKILVSKNNTDIYYEYLQFDPVKKVEFVDGFGDLQDRGIYYKFDDTTNYNYFFVPENVDYNPGSLSIYRNSDVSKTPLFTIFNDGRINTVNDNYKLEYSNFNDYISIKLIDSHFAREVGQVLFLNDSEYIMK